MAVKLAHATAKTTIRHPARQQEQYRVIARELIDAGVTPAEMKVWVSLRPSMHRIADAVTQELAAAR